jgi:hypothetical protein
VRQQGGLSIYDFASCAPGSLIIATKHATISGLRYANLRYKLGGPNASISSIGQTEVLNIATMQT